MLKRSIFFLFVLCLVAWSVGTPGTQARAPQVSESNPVPNYFWHTQTLGDPNAPYLADSEHFYLPNGVAVDEAGNLWVTEAMGARVLMYDPDGAFQMSIGVAGVLEVADETHLVSPNDVVVDASGDFWAADHGAQRVVKFSPAGVYMTQLGVTWQAGTDNAHFHGPVSIALDSAGNLYVSDIQNHRIQVFDSEAFYSATIGVTGVAGSDNDHFNIPLRIAVDHDDNLYVPDALNHRVQIFDASHTYVATLGVTGVPGDDNDHFNLPRGVAVDADFIYVADGDNHRVQIFDRDTRAYVNTIGSEGNGGLRVFDFR
jgi:tripartite motif-containing protein 71